MERRYAVGKPPGRIAGSLSRVSYTHEPSSWRCERCGKPLGDDTPVGYSYEVTTDGERVEESERFLGLYHATCLEHLTAERVTAG
jgi:hypothetical protein